MEYTELEKRLKVRFKDPSVLKQALTHSSFANENPGVEDNQRLEFLGDAVLGFIVAQMLYQSLPRASEGELTGLRARLVRDETLGRLARDIGLGDYLLLGKGEEVSGGREKESNLAGALEALIAATYLDSGLVTARRIIKEVFGKEIATLDISEDFKSRLQQIAHTTLQETPAYRIVSSSGPEHEPVFTAEVSVGKNILGRGTGRSKKAAETAAAREALEKTLQLQTPLLNSTREEAMSGKDYRHRESKKPKKTARKELAAEVIPLENPEVEVIGKRKKKQKEEVE